MTTTYFKNCLGVFQGGGCRAAAYVGAFIAAKERGVNFSEVAGTSAGAIIAVLIAAGAKPEYLKGVIRKLDFIKFMAPPDDVDEIKSPLSMRLASRIFGGGTIVSHLGTYSSIEIERFINKELSSILGVTSSVRFRDLKIPTSIVATDLKTRGIKIWSTSSTPDDEVAPAVRASCSIPFFFQPVNGRYMDGGALSNLPAFIFADRQETKNQRILAFGLEPEKVAAEYSISSFVDYLKQIAGTIVDGSQSVQLSTLRNKVYLLNIPTGDIQATDFKKITQENIDLLIRNGQQKVHSFFDEESSLIRANESRNNICDSYFQTYTAISQTTEWNITEVIISETTTDWVYKLFPTILGWLLNGANITVVLKENTDDEKHGPYRQRLLQTMGVNIHIVKELPIRAFIFNPQSKENSMVIVRSQRTKEFKLYDGVIYSGRADHTVIQLISQCFNSYVSGGSKVSIPKIETADPMDTIKLLKEHVPQYQSERVTIEIQKLEISSLRFLTRYVNEFKYIQVNKLIELYGVNGKQPFYPSKIMYSNGKQSLVTPPVVEFHGGIPIVIEGTTRLTYCYKNSVKEVFALVAKGVTSPLPSSGLFEPDQMLITSQEVEGKTRYPNFSHDNFRPIEKAIRNPLNTLL